MAFEILTKSLGLNSEEFTFQFQSHPDFPSALAFSDTLNFLGVKNDTYELEKKYWKELPEQFITIYKNNFALIIKDKTGYKVLSDTEKKISKSELLENSQDFVLLFEKADEKKERNKLNLSYFVYALFGLVLLYSVIFQNWGALVFNVLSMFGFYISLELFNKKFGKESTVITGICGATTSNTQKADCDAIIENDKINVLGLKFADFSLVYFIAILAIGLFLPITTGILKFISFASVLVIGYSLFMQIFIEKTFCKICLLVIAILSGQIVVSVLFFNDIFSVNTIILSIFTFLVIFFGLIFVNNLIEQKEKYRKSDIKNLRFKRNYVLFKTQLLEKEKINFQHTSFFSFGKANARLRISLVSNPYCGFCKDAHMILEKLLEKYPDDISAQIRFNYFETNTDEKYKQLMMDFCKVYASNEKFQFLKALDFWFQNKNESLLHQKFNSSNNQIDFAEIFKISKENKDYGFNFTPLFLINGNQFPDKYDREDLFYFIDELLDDEQVVNG